MAQSDEQQAITREVREDGSIEVSVTPITTNGVKTEYIDEFGVRHVGVITEQDLRGICNIPDDYVCISFKPNNWVQQQSVDKETTDVFIAHQAKGTFAPPHPGKAVIEDLLKSLESKSPVVPAIHNKLSRRPGEPRRMLEISIMDPHVGLQCFAPEADMDYDLDTAEQLYMWAVKELAVLGGAYGGVEEILFPIGNDYLHAEPMALNKGIGHTTSAGTIQPEMMAWHEVYMRGEELLRRAILFLSQIAPVTVVNIPGNHDRFSSFTLARVMHAYFANNENVTVDASPSPYKFKRYGVNLVGFEHGHSVAQVRLAALMANERPKDWAETKYREWHLGDQHRKGSSKPSMLEEQGVSVEYLPSITAPNEWHRLKSFNWQKRGAMAWVWDYDYGPVARLQVNIDSRTGLPYKD